MEPVIVEAGPTRFGFIVEPDRPLRQSGFGPEVTAGPLAFPAWLYPLAYPTWGEDPFTLPALVVTHASGSRTTRLVCRGHRVRTHDVGADHTFELVDPVEPITVRVRLRTWDDEGVVEQWVEVTNDQHAPIVVDAAAAAAPVLPGGDPRLDHFGGDWGAEFTPVHDRLTRGTKSLEARATTRPAHEVPPYVRYSPDGPVTETAGDTLAAALAWGGNLRMAFDMNGHGQVRAVLGHLPTPYVLDPAATLVTPRVVWAWSAEGTRRLTHRLHRWVRARVLRDGHRDRAVVVNNWEATGFDFDAARLARFAHEAADLDGEVFLLDDGWFGDEFPRNDDTAGLGDWVANPAKLPEGLAGVGRAAADAGVRFGVWVEPEMVNPDSGLYRDHPDWVVTAPGRQRRTERHQLQLDLCHAEVADHVVGVIDSVLAEPNGVDYLKWDANRMVTEPGSTALAADRQGCWPVDVVRATWAVMDRVVAAHPEVEMLLCASGGGRLDLGTLARFHEVWLSDDTDPVDRVRMQWHASSFLPVAALAAHVTRWGERPVAFACAVAMSARFGFDVNRDALDDEEWAICRRATAHYRRLRPIIQRGDLVRLISPEASSAAALAFLAPDRSEGVVFAYRLPRRDGDDPGVATVVPVAEVDPEATYTVTPVDLTSDDPGVSRRSSGAALVESGLAWPDRGPCTASIWHLGT